MNHTYYVPVRTSDIGTVALRTGRLESGERIGIAFTSEAALTLTLGASQPWSTMSDAALMDMLAPLGIAHLRIDPLPVGGAACPATAAAGAGSGQASASLARTIGATVDGSVAAGPVRQPGGLAAGARQADPHATDSREPQHWFVRPALAHIAALAIASKSQTGRHWDKGKAHRHPSRQAAIPAQDPLTRDGLTPVRLTQGGHRSRGSVARSR